MGQNLEERRRNAMIQIFRVLGFLVEIYMLIIFVRIVLTWFARMGQGRLQEILAGITDPYLDWFRRFSFLKVGFLDLSPIAALGVLSVLSRIISTVIFYGKITIGIILAIMLQTIWGAVSFFLLFFIIVLALRLAAHFSKQNIYGPFWRIVDTIAQPILYRINRLLFRDRIVNFGTGTIISIASLGLLYFVLRFLVSFLSVMLARLPL